MRLFFFVLSFILTLRLWAQVPGTLSYQGILTDVSGNPVADAPQTVLFNFYSVATGGAAIQSRGPLTLTTSKGLFTAIIGNGQGSNNAALPFNIGDQQIYVGIVANGGAELTPRAQLTTVPYAFRAAMATALDATATIAGGQVGAGINAANITTGLLPAAQIGSASIDNTKLANGIDASKITVGNLSLNGTDAVKIPSGTTVQRPASPVAGALRYNTTENIVEYYNGTNWYFIESKTAVLKDVKSSNAGTFTQGIWQTRDLNTLEGDNSFASISANQFTLIPGEYFIDGTAPAMGVGDHKVRLFNVTTSTVVALGTNEYADTSLGSSQSRVFASFTVSGSSQVFEIQHRCNLTKSNFGLGAGQGFSQEIYTQVFIKKLR